MFRTYKISSAKKGFTLIELMISLILITAMLGAIWVVYNTAYSVFYGQYGRELIKDRTSLVFLNMTTELHQALSVTAATATSMTFTADLNGDGAVETVQYTWSGIAGDPLNRISGTDTRQAVQSVSSLAFAYYGTDNVLLAFPVTVSQVRLVSVDATVTKGSESFHLRTKIGLQCI